jgi:hypothetical protein
MSGEKPTIVWDIDEVKAHTKQSILRSANTTFNLRLKTTDFSENLPKMVGKSREVTTDWFLGFCATEFPLLQPRAGMRELLADFSETFTHEQLTSRRSQFRDVTAAWTEQHYAGLVNALHMFRVDWDNDPQAHERTKADFLPEIEGAVALVDDEIKNAWQAAAVGYVGVRLCDPELASPSQFLADAPPTYYEVHSVDQLRQTLERAVVPLAA